jgi:hypothetical protein
MMVLNKPMWHLKINESCSRVQNAVCTELKCEITTELRDVKITEDNEMKLLLVISKPRDVTWLKNKQPVTASDRLQIGVTDDKLHHTLTISHAMMDDAAEYTTIIEDGQYGAGESSCKVTIDGKS